MYHNSMRQISDLVFVGFNSRVIAMDRISGEVVWTWKSPKGSSQHVAVMLDDDQLIVSISGYMYALDAETGEALWFNELSGMGYGIPSLTSVNGRCTAAAAADAQYRHHQQQQQG